MSNVLLLTKLQVMQAMGGLRATIEKRTGANGALAGTAIIVMIVLGGVGWLGWAAYGVLGRAGLQKTVFDILFLACGSLTFMFSLPTVLSSFFGSSDIGDLLPLPVSPLAIVISKALGALTSSYLWTLAFVAAPLAGWGIAAGAGAYYWMDWLAAVLFAPLMPTAYSGTLAILVATVFKRMRRKDTITTITTVVSIGASVGIYFVSNRLNGGSGAASTLGGMSGTLDGALMAFPAYGFAVHALQEPDPMGIIAFVLISVASFAAFVFVARFLYLRIVTSLSTGGAKAQALDGTLAQRQSGVLASLVRTEARRIVRNSSVLLYYAIYPLVITPVLLVVSLSSGGSLTDLAGSLAKYGDVTSVAAGIVLAFVILITTICCLSNKACATCVSREGSSWTYMKFVPVPMATQLLAKTLVGFALDVVIVCLFAGAGGIALAAAVGIDLQVAVCGLVLALGAAWLMCCVGTWADARNPNVEWGKDADVDPKTLKGNAGTLRGMLVGLVYAALPLLASPLTGLDPRVFMPIIAVIGVVCAVALGRMLLVLATHSATSFE